MFQSVRPGPGPGRARRAPGLAGRLLPSAAALLLAAALSLGAGTALADGHEDYPKVNPLSGDKESIVAGRDLYWKFCVQCHGSKADGVSTRWGGYAKDLRKWRYGYPMFVVTTLNGRPQKRMPPWGGYLDEDQISQIAAFLETLALEEARWK